MNGPTGKRVHRLTGPRANDEWKAEGGGRRAEGEKEKGRQLPLAGLEFPEPQPPPALTSGSIVAKSAVAIVGMAVSIGGAATLGDFAEAVRRKRSLIGPRPRDRWKGCDDLLPGLSELQGAFLNEIVLESARFHIPPREIPDILPQHMLMLKTAADAMADAGLPLAEDRPSMGAVIGIDFDFEATQFHLRWHLERVFPEWVRSRFPHLTPQQADQWLSDLKEACGPPLTSSRVLGALGSMVASRIARELHLGGPSFVVSAESASGLRALEIGVRALESGELDTVLVGAVDLHGDLRNVALRLENQVACPADGSVALVLQRLNDARSDGRRIYGTVAGLGAAGGGGIDMLGPSSAACVRSLSQALSHAGTPPDSVGWFESHASMDADGGRLAADSLAAGWPQVNTTLKPVSSATLVGDCGAAAGLVSLAKALIEMEHSGASGRSALVAATALDGNCMHVVLECPPGGFPHSKDLAETTPDGTPAKNIVRIPVGGRPLRIPPPPLPEPSTLQDVPDAAVPAGGLDATALGVLENMAAVSEATAKAHAVYLDLSLEITRAYSEAVQLQSRLAALSGDMSAHALPNSDRQLRLAFDRAQCLEFARGSAARVLGPEFAEVDTFPARVRLPDEPLMLVDRILEIQGAKGSLGAGRIITEHDVRPGVWYLDGGRAPVCISVEAGQADLFLCSYLGIDRVVRGRRTYRLLDATVKFYRELPRPGETIRYAIEIEKFIRQGETYLFLFRFEGTIGGRPLITMTDGCAGFFTPEEVAGSGGIILTDEEKKPLPGKIPTGWTFPVALAAEAYTEEALDALRAGNPAACFGEPFTGIVIPECLRLPAGRMRLIDRVLSLEPKGGRFGLGRIRAEADIHPDDWFLTCHFVDDRVMPGTLMYECCAHALRVLVQRMGWIIDRPDVRYEPVQGIAATLKCRGPVTPATKRVVYEIDVKELGCSPQPFVIADANMYADGHHIVRFTNMSLQLTGAAWSEIEAFWINRAAATAEAAPEVLFTRDRIEEFTTGRPSAAFGPPYAPFDSGRFIARLPAPPFLCVDRITRVEPPPWVVKPGGWIEAEFDVRPDAWYVAAERTGDVPYLHPARDGPAALRLAGGLHGLGPEKRERPAFPQSRGPGHPAPQTARRCGGPADQDPPDPRLRSNRHDHRTFRFRNSRPGGIGVRWVHLFRVFHRGRARSPGRPARCRREDRPGRRRYARWGASVRFPGRSAASSARSAAHAALRPDVSGQSVEHDRPHRVLPTGRRPQGTRIRGRHQGCRSGGMVFQGPFPPGPGGSRIARHRVFPAAYEVCRPPALAAPGRLAPLRPAYRPQPPLDIPRAGSALQPPGDGGGDYH